MLVPELNTRLIPEIMVGRSLMFMWSFGAVQITVPKTGEVYVGTRIMI